MQDIRPAIRSLLLANPPVNTMVGGSRIYTVIVPQGITAPSLVQHLITEDSDYHNAGSSGLGTARVQLSAWALTADDAVKLSNLAHDVLSGFRGTSSGVLFKGIFKHMGHEEYDDQARMFGHRRDFMVWFSET